MIAPRTIDALCPAFGQCGGCSYQNLSYAEELKIKHTHLTETLRHSVDLNRITIDPVVPSPQPYHYRHRLDLKLKRTKEGDILLGYTPQSKRGLIEVDHCPIAMKSISDFIPQLKLEATAKLPEKYREANIVVRTGDDQRIRWGGIGRRSLRLPEEKYMWTEIYGRKIFYSLDTFFQANLSILPLLFNKIIQLNIFTKQTVFYDLYGGVGFFSLGLLDHFAESVLIENCKPSVILAQHNIHYHQLKNMTLYEGNVEDELPKALTKHNTTSDNMAMIDPPRSGLSEHARTFISELRDFKYLLYLSCNPEALARDLHDFQNQYWRITHIIPFDFFPKTKHLETLVVLKREEAL